MSIKLNTGDSYNWSEYAKGVRPKVSGNKVTFKKTTNPEESYAAFRKYRDIIFMYIGTISVHRDLKVFDRKSEYNIGDVLVHPGSPGHAVVIVDKAKNA